MTRLVSTAASSPALPTSQLISRSPLALAVFDANGVFISGSPHWRSLVPELQVNRDTWASYLQRHPQFLAACRSGETVVSEPIEVRTEDGTVRWVRIEIGAGVAPDGVASYFVGHGRDVTDHQDTFLELIRSQERLDGALQMAGMVVQDVDLHTGRAVFAGSKEEWIELLSRGDESLHQVHPDDRSRIMAMIEAMYAKEGEQVIEGEHRLNCEPPTWVSTTCRKFVDQTGRPSRLVLMIHDVTDKVHARQEMERLAFTDALTGLPNRAKFQLEFDRLIAEADSDGRAVGLVMVDVDHFKDINDTLGHDAGDALLEALATQMRRVFRSTDVVARLGGDEFAILLPDLTSRADLVRPLDALRALLNTPIQYKGQGVRISTSIGAALHDDPDADASHLRKNADIALYKAKDLGRDRVVVFEPEMRSEIEKRLELLRDVRAAIPRGEFVLYYQPVVGLHESAVTWFEALMRWNHPDKGVLPPAEFMSAFEDQDLSVQLGSLAIETALKQMRAWMDQGLPFGTVAINLSAAQFRTGRLADDLRGRLQRWGVPPERLTVEVTENVYLGWGAEIVSETIRALHDHGVGIALDDFGTGYASLANLRQFPIDQLKIDKSFVQNADDDAVVRAVINLGASMGMEVVAEGVERPDQLNQLTRYGCRHVQGFHFAKPMPPEQVPGYLSDFKAAQKAQSAA
jgi:diguanylate cyclase (GGDEF)-like protein/PAS domain S-box-containing protein